MPSQEVTIRRATAADIPTLLEMQRSSVDRLVRRDYTREQIDAFMTHVGTLDPQLVEDGTYFLAESCNGIAVCGGWSFRTPLFDLRGGAGARSAKRRKAAGATAYVRSVFVHPDWTRRGLASRIMRHVEAEVAAEGFARVELTATLTGVLLYRRLGYGGEDWLCLRMPNKVLVPSVGMSKELDRTQDGRRVT